jgi:hypothetical protein
MSRLPAAVLATSALVVACSTPAPPTSRRVVAHESAADAAGTLLVVDVCLNHSPLGTDDYFVIGEARSGALALQGAVTRFFDASDVRILTQSIPFVCGAIHDPANAPKRVADAIDGSVSTRPQPLWVAPDVVADGDYVRALQTLATHVFLRSLAAVAAASPAPPAGSAPASPAAAEPSEAVRQAAALVLQRTGRSSLIYVGATGHSLSSGKAATFGAARIAAGVALSVAIGPVFTAGGASYGVVFVPGGPVDKRQMVAALFDLRKAGVVRSNVVNGGGDPMKPEVLANPEAVQMLLRDLAFSTAGR